MLFKENQSLLFAALIAACFNLIHSTECKGQLYDACSSALNVTPSASCTYSAFNVGGSHAVNGPAITICTYTIVDDAWLQFTANSAVTTIEYVNTTRDASLYLYSGTCPSSLTQLACADAWVTGTEAITYSTTIGTLYYVRVARVSGGATATMSGSYCIYQAASPPANDNCTAATLLTVNASCINESTSAATIEYGETKPCSNSGNQSTWYKFVATQSNMSVWVDNLMTGGCHLGSAVWGTSTCIPSGSPLSCKNGASPEDIWHHLTGLTIGNTYLIQVMYLRPGSCGSNQTFCISVIAPNTNSGYNFPVAGRQNTYNGDCMVSTSGAQFYDNGGSASNYSNSINNVYWTFCPDAANKVLQANINYVDLESNFDYLYIKNGPAQNSTTLWSGYQKGNSTITSTDTSGCLTFSFSSDGTITRNGWNISLASVNGTGPNGTDNNDADNSTNLCSDLSFSGYSTGPGLLSEGCSGCNLSENFSNWFYFQIQSSGILRFTLTPTNTSEDYDFALYGPNVTSSSLGTPRRCSYASNTGNTGMNGSATDTSEDVTGDAWISQLNVTAGETYFLMINKWSAGGSGFTISWSGSTASLDCNILPVEWLNFSATYLESENSVSIKWATASEKNSDYFIAEWSANRFDFYPLATIKSKGNSTTISQYEVKHNNPVSGRNYYRIRQTDVDGTETVSEIFYETVYRKKPQVTIAPNPAGEFLDITLTGSKASMAVVEIMNTKGLVINKHDIILNDNSQPARIYTGDIKPGFYFLSIISDDSAMRLNFVKQ